MPRITARGMAEMIAKPAHSQLRTLIGLKFPKQGPAQFRVPYYSPAVNAFRASLRSPTPNAVLAEASAKTQSIGNVSRRQNLERVYAEFGKMKLWERHLEVTKKSGVEIAIGSVELRASPDIEAIDDKGRPVVMYYNCRNFAFDTEEGKRLLEIAHWLFSQKEIEIAPNRFELIDLLSGQIHRIKTPRAATIKNMKTTAKVIEALWDNITP